MRLGVLSDTHNHLPAQVLDLFAGVDHILHAGDIGSHDILAALEAVAPVTAVWGNTDGFGIRHRVPEVASVNLGSTKIVILHGHRYGTPSPELLRPDHPEADIVIYGHTHRAAEDWIDGALYLNPGSAGAPRDGNDASVAILTIENDSISVAWLRLTRSD